VTGEKKRMKPHEKQKKQQDFVKREFREVLSALWRWDEGGAVVFPCGTEAG